MAKLQKAREVWLWPDPDGYEAAFNDARRIGRQCRVVAFHLKIDDAVMEYGLRGADIVGRLKAAKCA